MKNILDKIWRLRIAKVVVLLILIVIITPPLIFSGMWVGCRSDGKNNAIVAPSEKNLDLEQLENSTKVLQGYFRNEEQTYLTFPEWYIVYSAEEYAVSLAKNPPSKFPYFRSVGQYWKSYCNIYAITRNDYPFNFGYHVVLFVIGGSYSVENLVKGIYENTIGRTTELLSTANLTEEDRYAQKIAEEYGKFIHTVPWYEFPFKDKLKGLWRETNLWGPNPIRKWERKILLSIEYGFKSIYGWIIKGGTLTAYAPENLEIYAIAENLDSNILIQQPQVKLVERINQDYDIIVLPRYEAFTEIVPRLISQRVKFTEIAGNDEILISVIALKNWKLDINGASAIFSMPVLINRELERFVVNVQILNLHTVLAYLESEGVNLEHIYDY